MRRAFDWVENQNSNKWPNWITKVKYYFKKKQKKKKEASKVSRKLCLFNKKFLIKERKKNFEKAVLQTSGNLKKLSKF